MNDGNHKKEASAFLNPSKSSNSFWNSVAGILTLSKYSTSIATVVLFLATAWLHLNSPTNADFWWSDASRHAMDGVFWRDFFADFPIWDARQYAFDYYLKYPALTIVFYPPGFALSAAVVYAIFGISHMSAQLTVSFYYFAAAIGAYLLVKRWVDARSALAVSLFFIGIHEVAFWGRQVMLEIPAYAFAIWCVHIFIGYLNTRKPILLYTAAFLLAAGIYIKQTVVFLGVAFSVMLLWRCGLGILRKKHIWSTCIFFILLIAPVVIMGLVFGDINIKNVTSGFGWSVSRFSLENWLFYIKAMPSQLGWLILVIACLYPITSLLKREWQLPPATLGFFLIWILCGYVCFSLLAIKETRHSIFILFPFALFAVLALRGILGTKRGSILAIILSILNLAFVINFNKVPYVTGYREAAQYIGRHAPRNSCILFAGQRDGAFIFNMRAYQNRSDLYVLRADRLFTKVEVFRTNDTEQIPMTSEKMQDLMKRYGISYIVFQPNFWNDVTGFQQLDQILRSPQFMLRNRVSIDSNVPHEDLELELFQNLAWEPITDISIKLELPTAGMTIEGTLVKTE